MILNDQQARDALQSADLVCPATQIQQRVARMAADINAALAHECPLVLVVMRGGVVFAGQLLTQLAFPLEVDSIDATRYGNATQGGDVQFRAMPLANVAGRTVLLIDDILDEGITLKAIRDKLMAMQAKRVWIAVLAEKLTGNAKPLRADFVGVVLPNRYVFGFGMDVHGYWRNLPAIYALKEQG